jgi:spore coat protein U-like protein
MSWQEYDNQRIGALKGVAVGSKTHDFPATAATQGAEVSTTVTVPGAAVGDIAIATFSLPLGAAVLEAAVTAANTVTVRLVNTTAVAVNLAEGTLKATVIKT